MYGSMAIARTVELQWVLKQVGNAGFKDQDLYKTFASPFGSLRAWLRMTLLLLIDQTHVFASKYYAVFTLDLIINCGFYWNCLAKASHPNGISGKNRPL